jgi:pSer/pThr/pTyr-binding forkhead associated (FHA) protein
MRLVALHQGPDIPLEKAMIVVGRHPMCDTRLYSNRVSRHHCCMTVVSGELVVKDLDSTNGIQVNGHRVRIGRLRPGDVLTIADIHYVLDVGQGQDLTLADVLGPDHPQGDDENVPSGNPPTGENPAGGNRFCKHVDVEAQSASGSPREISNPR